MATAGRVAGLAVAAHCAAPHYLAAHYVVADTAAGSNVGRTDGTDAEIDWIAAAVGHLTAHQRSTGRYPVEAALVPLVVARCAGSGYGVDVSLASAAGFAAAARRLDRHSHRNSSAYVWPSAMAE